MLVLCLVIVLGGGRASDACAYGSGMERLNLAAQDRTVQDRAADQDTLSPVRFDIDVAAGNSQIEEAGGDEALFVTLGLMPEFYYGKVGVGLLLRLRIHSESGTLRDEDFDDARDYLALLYFVQYGEEDDPAGYGRFGSLEDVTLGYGLFIDRYTNELSLDDPMRGVVGAFSTDHLRFEGMYSDLAAPGIFGFHTAYHPFGTASAPIGTASALTSPQLTIGFGVAGELSNHGALVHPTAPGDPFVPPGNTHAAAVPPGADDGDLYMVGVDAGVRWMETERVSILTFAEVAKILDYGMGATLGLRSTTELGRGRLQVQYAQRFLGAQFLPDYFGPTYEAERIRQVTLPVGEEEIDAVDTRRNKLAGRKEPARGFQVRFQGDYADAFESEVSYETIWEEPGSSRFHFDLQLHAPSIPVSVRLGYDRFDMEALSDVFTPSGENALYRLGLAYQVIEPFRLGIDFRQTYETVYYSSRAVGRQKQNRIEPFVQLVWQF